MTIESHNRYPWLAPTVYIIIGALLSAFFVGWFGWGINVLKMQNSDTEKLKGCASLLTPIAVILGLIFGLWRTKIAGDTLLTERFSQAIDHLESEGQSRRSRTTRGVVVVDTLVLIARQ